ncbi:Putative mutT protein [Streptomyces venezuelae]|uniref:GNAT family N-acetyltransferase n=1 Tax=Streptomyces gardneri TaxID=66892 RepID=UPI0006BD6954|nr:GNAT family N-acetyltransferase [Streptomyces gardneri]ALO10041.1 Putative mutT protein [Streptomyces venezuelae]QPK47076.1 GNAT family N-acetyltransferase [Streptomyces gardneri]WRK38493.1 GNAT family N-acetyltransferase [Streptomyces venezuelae]CUM39513.1 putative mutT-like protein [Streptomyces venezuelae]
MIVETLAPKALEDGAALPGPLLTELTALYASNERFHELSGDFPDPADVRPEQVAAALADDLAGPSAEVLLARSEGRLVAVAVTLAHHPDPADPDPWLGLLLVHAEEHRAGHGRRLAAYVENHFRDQGRTGLRLAVLENNPEALAFWTSQGYEEIARRPDLDHGRPCVVMRKGLG